MSSGKQWLARLLAGYFRTVIVLLVALFFVSWGMDIYFDGIEGLLSARGIRWLCSYILPNFAAVPLAVIILLLMAFSVVRESGLFQVFRRHVSLKQKRALQITGLASLVVVCLFSLLLILPDAVLLSAFGTIRQSAFSKGLPGLLLCMVIFVGNVYGYTAGRFVTMRDFVRAHVSVFSSVADYFVYLFLASQFIGCLQFTGILTLLGDDAFLLSVLRGLFYDIPLCCYILLAL